MSKVKNFFCSIGNWFKNLFRKDEDGLTGIHKSLQTDSGKTLIASLVCVVIGLIIGIIVIIILNAEHAGTAIGQILKGGFNAPVKLKGIAKVITESIPLLLCGLSILFAYKCGMFNIGAAGQYVMGVFFVYIGALALHLPWYLCLVLGAVGGALWGAIPGIFKAFLNVNEVITSIMFNWIGLYLINGIMVGNTEIFYDRMNAKCYGIPSKSPQSILPTLGLDKLFKNYQYIGIGIFIAIIAVIVISIILNKTKFGYEIKATGSNKNAAKYAGMNDKKNIIITMAISGALAGLAAGCYFLSGIEQWNPNVNTALPAVGFNGIAVAFLGGLSPIGTVLATLFITHITVGGGYLNNSYYSTEVAQLISSVIIYACAFSLFIKMFIDKKKKQSTMKLQGEDVTQIQSVENAQTLSESKEESEGGHENA